MVSQAGILAGLGVGVPFYGKTAWSYSRSMFSLDAEMRLDRFMTGYDFANTQMEQYRNDITKITGLTVSKMSTYTVVGTMGMAIMIALFCAGRLGLHGPSPPIWMMSLFLTNSGVAFTFCGMGIFFGLHAIWQAQACATHMLTRKTRLLIPSTKQLDQARKYFSQWEHQKLRDIFRLPYVGDAVGWKYSGAIPDYGEMDEDETGRARSAPARTKRVPGWFEEEYEQERAGISGMAAAHPPEPGAQPDHFRMLMKCQKDWFKFDCYCRICMLYGFLSFYQGVSYYWLGQHGVELRAFWLLFTAPWITSLAVFLIIKFDVKNHDNRPQFLPNCQYLGPLAIIPASIAFALDFRVEYDPVAIALTWVFIFIAFLFQTIYSFRLVELIIPSEVRMSFDSALGMAWWPSDWQVPAAFQHILYFVCPPDKLQPGQNDIVREIKDGAYVMAQRQTGKPMNFSSPNDLENMVDGTFEWLFSAAWPHLTPDVQNQVQRIHKSYEDASKKPKDVYIRETKDIAMELDKIRSQVQFEDQSGSGSGSDYGSEASYASNSSSKASAKGGKMRQREMEKAMHPEEPDYMRYSYVEPWHLLCIVTTTLAFSWVFLCIGMFVDVFVGVQGLITAPHWARPPMTRASLVPYERGTPLGREQHGSGTEVWLPEEMWWSENVAPRPLGWVPHWWQDFSHGENVRRLTSSPFATTRYNFAQTHRTYTTGFNHALGNFFGALDGFNSHASPIAKDWQPHSVQWPGFFEPRLLACEPAREGHEPVVAAISARGMAVAAQTRGASSVDTFSLTGLSEFPQLLGASWSKDGLVMVSGAGDVLSCPGSRPSAGGQWACGHFNGVPHRVPTAHEGQIMAATASWMTTSEGNSRLHVALVSKNAPGIVVLWRLDEKSWELLGEIRLPPSKETSRSVTPSLSFAGDSDIVIVTSGNEIMRRRVTDGSVVKSEAQFDKAPLAMHSDGSDAIKWQGVCGMHGSDALAHLSLRESSSSHTLRPQLMMTRQS